VGVGDGIDVVKALQPASAIARLNARSGKTPAAGIFVHRFIGLQCSLSTCRNQESKFILQHDKQSKHSTEKDSGKVISNRIPGQSHECHLWLDRDSFRPYRTKAMVWIRFFKKARKAALLGRNDHFLAKKEAKNGVCCY
jgi:hypothetical protein